MPSDTTDRRSAARSQNAAIANAVGGGGSMAHKAAAPLATAPQPQTEALPCPRCDSTNTKFCYYNNYNLSQPRHFCKSCRRYWTHGGTLRNIPVGGGTRKSSSKRPRSCSAASPSLSSSSSSCTSPSPVPVHVADSISGLNQEVKPELGLGAHGKMSENVATVVGASSGCGGGGGGVASFTSFLNGQGQGFLALGGFGSGFGPGYEGMGLGFGRAVWPFAEVGFADGAGVYGGGAAAAPAGGGGGGGGGSAAGCNTWQMGSGEGGGFVDGDGFSWPELAISMPGQGLK